MRIREGIVEDYKLKEPALHRLALIVRGADVKGQEHVSPESLGLRAIAHGFAASGMSDEERLVGEFPMYDALYEHIRRQLKEQQQPRFLDFSKSNTRRLVTCFVSCKKEW